MTTRSKRTRNICNKRTRSKLRCPASSLLPPTHRHSQLTHSPVNTMSRAKRSSDVDKTHWSGDLLVCRLSRLPTLPPAHRHNRIYIYIFTHTYVYTYMHAYTHTHTHTHNHRNTETHTHHARFFDIQICQRTGSVVVKREWDLYPQACSVRATTLERGAGLDSNLA